MRLQKCGWVRALFTRHLDKSSKKFRYEFISLLKGTIPCLNIRNFSFSQRSSTTSKMWLELWKKPNTSIFAYKKFGMNYQKKSIMVFLNGRNIDDPFLLFCIFQTFLNKYRFLLQFKRKKKTSYIKNLFFSRAQDLEIHFFWWTCLFLIFNELICIRYLQLCSMLLVTIVFVIVIIQKCYVTQHFGRPSSIVVKNMSQVWSAEVVMLTA